MTPFVSVIIVNLNGLHLLGDCLGSLEKQSFRDFEIIFVDNGSTDGSVDFVKNKYPKIRVIENNRNLGFGAGNNSGIKSAKGDFVALLNNDAVGHGDWLKELVSAAGETPQGFGMWASKILFKETPDIIDTFGHLIYPDGLNIGRGKGEKDTGQYDTKEEVFFPSGCAALYLKKMLDEIGLFDPDFFAYGDDTELGLRARLSGWKCLSVPASIVYHKGSATAGRYSPFKVYHVERNRLWVLLKCFPIKYILLSPFYTAKRLFYHSVFAMRGKGAAGKFSGSKVELAGVYLKAVVDGLIGAAGAVGKRKEIKRAVSGEEFDGWLRRFGISARDMALKE